MSSLAQGFRRHASVEERRVPTQFDFANILDKKMGFRLYRKSMFRFVVKRKELCDFDDEYYCTYKFDVHAGNDKDVHDFEDSNCLRGVTSDVVSLYGQKIPSDIASADDRGILLIIVLQWDVPHPTHRLIVHLGTRDRAFFVSNWELVFVLTDILSNVLHGLGILSPEDNQFVTSKLVNSVISLYQTTQRDDPSGGRWMPLLVKVAVERFVPLKPELKLAGDYFLWGSRDCRRFTKGFKLMKKNKALELEAERECCAICLREFRADHEIVQMPSCSHNYHPNCILEWLNKKQTCPSCRATVSARSEWRASANHLLLE